MGILNWCFAQLCKISTDMFYCACTVLTSELGELWEPVICRKGDQIIPFWIWAFVQKSHSFWLQTKSSSQSPLATTHQLANLDFSAPADPSVDWNPVYLDTLDSESCEGCCNMCHNDTLVESLSARFFAGLLLEVSDYRHKDLYLYGSFELMVLFFEPTMVCGLMYQNWSPGSDLTPSAVAHAILIVQDCTVSDLQ